jgi:hypothetical protein
MPARIVQVIGNLLNNAAKYTPQGGEIRLAARREGNEAVLEVPTTASASRRIAGPRCSRCSPSSHQHSAAAKGGLGIGLSLVRTWCSCTAAGVGAASAGIGEGSTFTVRLPLAAAAAAAGSACALGAGCRDGRRQPVAGAGRGRQHRCRRLAGRRCCAWRARYGRVDGEAAVRLAAVSCPGSPSSTSACRAWTATARRAAIRALPGLAAVRLVALTGWGAPEDRRRSRPPGSMPPAQARGAGNRLAITASPRLQCVTFLKGHACTMNSKQCFPASRSPS